MKSGFRAISMLTILCGAALLATGPAVAGAAAPLYPGPTLKGERVEQTEAGEGHSETIVWDVYYAKDPRARVTAFYRKKGYKVSNNGPKETVFVAPGKGLDDGWSVRVGKGRDVREIEHFFSPLEDEVMQQGGMQSVGLTGKAHTQKDLDAVKAKYGFLATEAFLPDGSIEDRLSACEDRISAGMDQFNDESESIDQKMQQLAMQGRYDEMQKLANQRMAQGMPGSTASHWDEWIACYDALARDVYRTEILIRVK